MMEQREVLEPFERMLAEHFSPGAIRRIEAGQDWSGAWEQVARSGFLDALVPEAAGGSGLGWETAGALFRALGRFAVPLPVGETLIARALLSSAGAVVPEGPIALCPQAGLVIGGAVAVHVLVAGGKRAQLMVGPLEDTGVHGSLDALAGKFDGEFQLEIDPVGINSAAALLHAALIAGAADRVLEMSVGYANERHQFGKPIGRQQAVQQQLAVMAEETVAIRLAVELAGAGERGLNPLSAAAAKAIASRYAASIAATAHAVHGAMGISAEYDLQLLTRRMHAWRFAGGAETHWETGLGRALLADQASAFEWMRGQIHP